MKELIAFINGEKLTLADRALAHSQANEVEGQLSETFWFQEPYSDFTSFELLRIGDEITRDYSKWPGDGKGLTIFPYHVKKAQPGDVVMGTVIKAEKAGRGEAWGLYLYADAKDRGPMKKGTKNDEFISPSRKD